MDRAAKRAANEGGGGPPHQTRPENARALILATAARLFRERGYAETSLRDIAALVGIKAGSIYYHFASKEEIATEVMNEGIRVVSDAVTEALTALPRSAKPPDRLRCAIDAHLSALLEASVFTSAHIRIYGYVPAEVRKAAAKARAGYDGVWKSLLDELSASGHIRRGTDLTLLRLAILGTLNWSLEWYDVEARSPHEIAGAFFDIFTRGILVMDRLPGPRVTRRCA
jgi:AcrR family transcriptional regulator